MGGSITRRFAQSGCHHVYFTYNNSVDEAKQIEKEITCAKGIPCDFRHKNSIDHLLSQMEEMSLDVLINNALTGMNTKHFHQSNPEGFLISFKENVMPTLRITQKAIKEFRKKKSGRIITLLTSYTVNRPPLGLSEYVANKSYLLSLSRSWAEENKRHNITSNCISPSMMNTSLVSHLDERQIEEITNASPLKCLLTTDEVSDAVFFLASGSRHINGVNLLINGGVDVV